MIRPLSRRLAVVTGGARGIGLAVAEKLVRLGAEVVVTGTKLGRRGPKGADYRAVDFLDRGAVDAFARGLSRAGVDILINNAGINVVAECERADPRDFDRIHDVNLRAAFVLCRAALPGMKRRRWGRIVNIASILSVVGKVGRVSYCASKFGIDGMTAALAAEAAPYGVLANCVSPGYIDTDLTRKIVGPAGMRRLARQIPQGRLGKPEEIANFVAWLCGPENTYISGQNLVIDGGFTRV